jgi:trehalose/maltose hydrolase-like predicted phosphorylase
MRLKPLGVSGYIPDGEEKLEPLPGELQTQILVDGRTLKLEGRYRRTLDMRNGALLTEYGVSGGGSVEVFQRCSRRSGDLAERWRLKLPRPREVTMTFSIPNGRKSEDSASWTAGPYKVSVAATDPGLQVGGSGYTITRGQGHEFEFVRTVSIGKEPTPAHKVFGEEPVQLPHISIEGPRADQDAIRSMIFYLYALGRCRPPSPFGWSNKTYFGHAFWDADVWVLPAASFLLPEVARSIVEYRLDLTQRGQYRKNYRRWATQDAPEAGINADHAAQAIMVPWESSISGLETVPGPSRKQHHVTGSVLWGLSFAEAFGHVDGRQQGAFKEFLAGAQEFWRQRSVQRHDKKLEIRSVMSPDEFHTGDNDLYTNLLAQWTLNDRSWSTSKGEFVLPEDDTSFLTYEGDRVRHYKQAAAMLAVYPLQYPKAEAQALKMLSRFSDKVTPNGPAMSESIHAAVEARFGDREAAYARWKRSWEPYCDHPLMLFSEKPLRDVSYFVTGAGGCLQAFLYGILGFRVDDRAQIGSLWSLPLKNGKVLSVRPNLPSAWKRVELKGVPLLGKVTDFSLTNEQVVVRLH